MYPFTKNLEVAVKECARLSWTLLAIKPYSGHKDDTHLAIILSCAANVKGILQFQTHVCNSETSGSYCGVLFCGNLSCGNYFPKFTDAITNFNQRGNK